MQVGFHRELPHRLIVCTDKVLTPDLEILKNRLLLLAQVERVDHAKSTPKQVTLELLWVPTSAELSRLKTEIMRELSVFFREEVIQVPFEEICEDEKIIGTREE